MGDIINYLRNNTFGIEIEFTQLRLFMAARAMRALPLRHKVRYTNGFRKSNGEFWDVKTDASVSHSIEYGNGFTPVGGEIASPKLTPSKTSFKEIERVFNSIINAGARFTADCGLHIHIDITGVDRFKLLMMILKYENELYIDFAKSRLKSSFIRPLKRLTPRQLEKKLHIKLGEMVTDETLKKLLKKNHYSAFYFYKRQGKPMIEMRMGQSTNDVEKSLNWIKFILSKVKESRDMDILESLYNEN